MSGFESVKSARQQQLEIRAQLRAGLSSLPAPKNDFEIVVPEDEGGMEVEEGSEVDPYYVEDAAEVDERRAKALKEAGEQLAGGRGGAVAVVVEKKLLVSKSLTKCDLLYR